MKKITRKLSMKYKKLNKSRLREEGSMKSEEYGGELHGETYWPEKSESNDQTKESPKVTKLMESMHRKLMLREKTNKKYNHTDGYDQSQMFERSVRNGGRDRSDQLEGSVRNMEQHVGSVKTSHMDHLEELIKGYDRKEHTEGSIKNNARNRVDKLEDNTVKTTKNASDFASKKDYLDWIEYVEGSNHHCFDRSEKPYEREDNDHDKISLGVSEGYIEGNNDEMFLLKSSKNRDTECLKIQKVIRK